MAVSLGILIAYFLLREEGARGIDNGHANRGTIADGRSFAQADEHRAFERSVAGAPEAGSAVPNQGRQDKEPPFSEQEPYSVTIRIVDDDGKPVSRGFNFECRRSIPGADYEQVESFVDVGTNKDGICRIDLSKPGSCRAVLEETGRISLTVDVTDERPNAEIRMRIGCIALTGQVDGLYGSVDPNALMVHLGSADSTDPDRGGTSAKLDANRKFVIPELTAGDYVLSVPGSFHFERIRIDRNTYHVVRLSRGRIGGKVIDKETGVAPHGYPWIALNALSLAGVDPSIVPPNLTKEFRLGGDGSFLVSDVPMGRYRLHAFCKGYSPGTREIELLNPTDILRVDLELKRKEEGR